MNDIIIGGSEMSQFYVKPVIFGCPVTQRTENAKSASNIFIIDTLGEYSSFIKMMGGTSILISNDSANYINPFEYDLSLLNDEKIDVISDKCQLITALISLNQKLSLSEISFIDHCVRQSYLCSNFYKSHNKSDFPILRNLCDIRDAPFITMPITALHSYLLYRVPQNILPSLNLHQFQTHTEL